MLAWPLTNICLFFLEHLRKVRLKLPALAGIVHGVVVQTATCKSGKKSCSELSRLEGMLINLNIAYMLLEEWPSGYYASEAGTC